jgi:hypothetical protein
MLRSLAPILLGLSAVLFAAFGAGFAFAPSWMASHVDLALTSPTARADVAAIYGGLELGLGAFLGLCLLRGRLRTGLLAAGLALAGIALVRGFHLAAYGGEAMLWAVLAAETAGAAMSLWLVGSVTDGGPTSAAA